MHKKARFGFFQKEHFHTHFQKNEKRKVQTLCALHTTFIVYVCGRRRSPSTPSSVCLSVRPSIVYLSIGRGCCRRCLYHCQKYMKNFRSVWTCIKLLGGAGRAVRLTTDTFVLNVNKKHECMYGRRTHFLFSFRLQCR